MYIFMVYMTEALYQGRIQDLKKEGAQGVRGLTPKIFLANLRDFAKILAQKGVGMRPLRPPPHWIRACICMLYIVAV